MVNNHQSFMEIAIKEAQKSVAAGEWPGGSVITLKDKVIAKEQNYVQRGRDATLHAEIAALRKASQIQQSWDLTGAVLYTTAEPCPMCFTACVWANISAVYFGVSLEDLVSLGDYQIKVSAQEIADKSFRPIIVRGGILKEKCLEVSRLSP